MPSHKRSRPKKARKRQVRLAPNPAYFMMKQAAVMRHMMVGMPPPLHFMLMQMFYPI